MTMFDYLKTLYRSMKLASYYNEIASTTPRHEMRDELAALMAIKS
jgi:hypothetical protein